MTKPLIIEPESGNYTHVIFFAHGLGSNPEAFYNHFKITNFKLKNQTKFVLFRAPKIHVNLTNTYTTV